MPAGQGEDEERFAAATEFGSPPGADAREELAHELALAAALDRSRTSLSPDADASARMRQRLFAALAEHGGQDGPPPPPAPSATEQTAPLGRPLIAVPTPGPTTELAAEAPDTSEVTTELNVVGGVEPAAETTAAFGHGVTRGRARHKMPNRAIDRRRDGRGSRRPGAGSGRRRVGIVGVAALAVMVALAGAGAIVSRGALPGDALYGIKRVAESAGLAMTFGDEAKARRHLELAATRLGEIEQLLAQQRTSAPDPQLLEAAINAFDSATSEGSRMMLGGQQAPGGAGLGDLRTWVAQQSARLAALRSGLPNPTLAEADQSMALLERLLGRTEALRIRMSCSEVTSGVDDLGPVPAEGACAPKSEAGNPARSAGSGQSSSAGSSTSQSNGRAPTPSVPGGSSQSTAPGGEHGLLPGVGPENGPLGDNPSLPGGTSARSSTSAPAPGGSQVPVPAPLPLLPPIQLPPLLPGMPGITIG